MNLHAQHILMNWIGIVAVFLTASRLMEAQRNSAEIQQSGRTPNQCLDQKFKIQ